MSYNIKYNQSKTDIEIQKEISDIFIENRNILLLKFSVDPKNITWHFNTAASFLKVGITHNIEFVSNWGQLYLTVEYSKEVLNFFRSQRYNYFLDTDNNLVLIFKGIDEFRKVFPLILKEL